MLAHVFAKIEGNTLVVKPEPKDREFLTRYLLRELSEVEATALEMECVEDDELFQRLKATEIEVTDDYIRGKLSPKQTQLFDKTLTNVPGRQDQVELGRSILGVTAERKTAWRGFPSWIKNPGSRSAARAETNQPTRAASPNASQTQSLQSARSQQTQTAVFDRDYLVRFREGDDETAKHFLNHFRTLLRTRFAAKFGKQTRDEMIDEILGKAVEAIMQGKVQDAAKLPAYVLAFSGRAVAQARSRQSMPNVGPALAARIEFAEAIRPGESVQVDNVRRVLATLTPRDRGILEDLFFYQLSKEEVCNKYKITGDHLRLALFRLRKRFQMSKPEPQS